MGKHQDYFLIPKWPCYLAAILMLALAIGAVVERGWWLTQLGAWLVASDDLQPVDVIVSLGGGAGHRERYAATLYQRGLAPRILVTGSSVQLPGLDDIAYAELATRELTSHGVPAAAVVTVASSSTRDDAEQARTVVQQQGWHSLILVSDPYHMRRALLTFTQVFRGTGIRLVPRPAEPNWFAVEGWWQRERSFQAVVGEYEKLLYYLFNGYLL